MLAPLEQTQGVPPPVSLRLPTVTCYLYMVDALKTNNDNHPPPDKKKEQQFIKILVAFCQTTMEDDGAMPFWSMEGSPGGLQCGAASSR